MSWNYYENEVEIWGHDRGIIKNGKPMGQAVKTLEETTELVDAINRNDPKAIKDAVGDIFVTLLMQCAIQGFTATEALKAAYEEIKDRKGFLRPDGVFVKDV
jgi:phosphoribosyl-ATP pyrophosphohydrolase